MPRILVADDNSNIQKMVSLALKDTGVDVIAVGNGEAAVRKLPDAKPDLVLADIFMPVRNGYEVCEFIKHDSRYAHVPVVLLVGAFDPLDEREAQRVGADGILKKPFVPPDPLITMVKDLLAKSEGERLVAVGVPVAVSSAATADAEVPATTTAAPKAAGLPPVPEFQDVAPEEIAPPVSRLDFSGQEKTVAFSSLLDAPAETPVDDADVTVTATRDPHLGEPAFWSQPATDEPSDEEAVEDHSWGRQVDPLPFGVEGAVLPAVEAARAAELVQEPAKAPVADPQPALANEPTESVLELPSVHAIEFAQPDSAVAAAPPTAEFAPDPFEDSIPLPHLDSLLAPPQVPQLSTAPEVTQASAMELPSIDLPPVELPKAPALSQSHQPTSPISVDSIPAPWEPKSAVNAGANGSAQQDPDATAQDVPEVPAWLANVTPIFAAVPSSRPEPIAELTTPPSENDHAPIVSPAEPAEHFASVPHAIPVVSEMTAAPATTPLSSEEVEAVVTRIVERMQPKVFEVVTQEILRPLVEALVRREIEKH